MILILVAAGGFLGAISRYAIGNWTKAKLKSSFPFGTFFVNLVGSFFLGYLFARSIDHIYSLLGVGFLGAFTTFSTMNVEAIQLYIEKKVKISVMYLTITYVVGIILAYVGYLAGTV